MYIYIYSLQIISGTYSIENWVLTSKYLSLTSSQKWMNGHRAATSETIEVAGNPMFFSQMFDSLIFVGFFHVKMFEHLQNGKNNFFTKT